MPPLGKRASEDVVNAVPNKNGVFEVVNIDPTSHLDHIGGASRTSLRDMRPFDEHEQAQHWEYSHSTSDNCNG